MKLLVLGVIAADVVLVLKEENLVLDLEHGGHVLVGVLEVIH